MSLRTGQLKPFMKWATVESRKLPVPGFRPEAPCTRGCREGMPWTWRWARPPLGCFLALGVCGEH